MKYYPVCFISWAPNCTRSDNIARELKGKSYMVYHFFWGSNYFTIAFKYFTQTIETLYILFRDRPKSVICMSPPVPSIVSAWLYSLIFKKPFAIDYHTAAFVLRAQKSLFFMQSFFARRAATNILTNSKLEDIVKQWGGKTILISDVRVEFDKLRQHKKLRDGFNVTFVSRFSSTEPLDVVYEAARQLKSLNVNIYVTGDTRDASQEDIQNCPDNVELTGFLDLPEYAGLLRDSDAVLCLCTNDNTMQRGAYEALSVETPLILSDWQILRETFSKGSIYVQNTVPGVVAGIQQAIEKKEQLDNEIKELKYIRSERWNEVEKKLRHELKLEDNK